MHWLDVRRLGPAWTLGLVAWALCGCGLSCVYAQTSEKSSVSLVVVGDIMLAGRPEAAMRRGADPFAGFAKLLAQADVRLGNLEFVFSTRGSAEPDKPNTFRVHPRWLRHVRQHFDAVSLANNHSGDFGPQAFADMLGHLQQAQLGFYGGGINLAQAHRPWLVERRGVRIAVLGYDEFQPRSFEADSHKPGVAWSEDAQVVHDIQAARRQWGAHVVITHMHWGWEGSASNARQQQLARLMIDAGADAVIGGHPHQLQETDSYRGKPIFYSLGNFVFEGFAEPVNNLGWAVQLEIDRQGVQSWQAHQVLINASGLPKPGKVLQRVNLRSGPFVNMNSIP